MSEEVHSKLLFFIGVSTEVPGSTKGKDTISDTIIHCRQLTKEVGDKRDIRRRKS